MTGRIGSIIERHPWRLVGLLVLISAIARYLVALRTHTPWIFGDELIYSEQAKGIAEALQLRVRDGSVYYSLVTGLLGAPGYLFGSVDVAYHWIKAVNALVMSLAAIPAFGMARMALSARASLLFAVIALALPSFAYTANVMTEPAFYPALLLFAWLLARTLIDPTLRRQAATAAALILCVAVRLQAVALLATLVIACAGWVLLAGPIADGAWLARVRRILPLAVFAVGLPLLVIAAQLARGRTIGSVLGGYEQLDPGSVSLGSLWTWTVRHFAVVVIAVAIVPAVLAIAGLPRMLRPGAPPAVRAVAIGAVSMAVPIILEVAGFASVHSLRVEERNLFFLEPLLILLAMVALSHRLVSIAGAVVGAVMVAWAVIALPVEQLTTPPPYSDTFALVALRGAAGTLGIGVGTLLNVILVGGLVLTGLALMVPGRRGLALALAVPVVLIVGANHYVSDAYATLSRDVAPYAGTTRDWVDRAVGRDVRADMLWSSDETPVLVWQTEFWNRSLGRILTFPGDVPGPPGARVEIDPSTGAVTSAGAPVVPPDGLVVATPRFRLAGRRIAEAPTPAGTMTLWRMQGPLRLDTVTTGFTPDGWTGPAVEARAYACRGGTFRFRLALGFGRDQRALVTTTGMPSRSFMVSDRVPRVVSVPVRPERPGGTCVVRIAFPDAQSGDEAVHNGDLRVLGVRSRQPTWIPAAG